MSGPTGCRRGLLSVAFLEVVSLLTGSQSGPGQADLVGSLGPCLPITTENHGVDSSILSLATRKPLHSVPFGCAATTAVAAPKA
jgi:hypothetical protein